MHTSILISFSRECVCLHICLALSRHFSHVIAVNVHYCVGSSIVCFDAGAGGYGSQGTGTGTGSGTGSGVGSGTGSGVGSGTGTGVGSGTGHHKGAEYDQSGGQVDDRSAMQKIKDKLTPGSDVGKHTKQ